MAAAAVAPKKNPPPKPPIARSKIKNQPTPTPVAATDLEADVTASVDAEYDTDELAELPTDSDSEAVESEQGGRSHSIRSTMTINLRRGRGE